MEGVNQEKFNQGCAMARIARLKVKGEPAVYHVVSRTTLEGFAGLPGTPMISCFSLRKPEV